MKLSTLAPVSLTLIAFPLLSACGQSMGPGQQGYMMNMPFGGLFMLVVLAALVIFIAMTLKGVVGGSRTGERPLDILKRRYANGEIDRNEFERMKKDLTDD